MTYTKRTDIDTSVAAQHDDRGVITVGFDSGESVVEIQSGNLVAVGCKMYRCTSSQCTVLEFCVRWIHENGGTRVDIEGVPVITIHKHTTSDEELDLHGENAIKYAGLCLMLGEQMPTYTLDDGTESLIVPFSEDCRAQCNINRAIAASVGTQNAVQSGTLL